MRIAVLGNAPNWSFTDLQRAAAGDFELVFAPWQQLIASVGAAESINCGVGPVDACLVRGMPHGSLEQIIFQMNVLARWQAAGTPIVNSPRSLEIAIDKYLSLALIRQAGLPIPESIACQSVEAAMQAFDSLGRDVVIKPVFGGEGRGIVRVSDPEIALRSFRAITNFGSIIFLQAFIDSNHQDFRLLVVGDRVLAMRRHNPNDWRSNATRGAFCESFEPDQPMIDLAFAAAEAVGTDVAGVDLIADRSGQNFVLEVNGVPGWKSINQVCGRDVSRLVLEWVAQPGKRAHPGKPGNPGRKAAEIV